MCVVEEVIFQFPSFAGVWSYLLKQAHDYFLEVSLVGGVVTENNAILLRDEHVKYTHFII